MSVVIRPYLAKDKADVIRLLIDLQDHVAKLDPLRRLRSARNFDGVRYFKLMRQGKTAQHRKFLVAKAAGAVVGVVVVTEISKPPPINLVARKASAQKGGRIEDLIVDSSQRGRGVGKKLLKAAEIYLRQRGCGVVFIGCFATNTKTLDFYRSQGYVERNIEFAKRI